MGKSKMATQDGRPCWWHKAVNGNNFCSRRESWMILVSNYRLSGMSNSTRYIKIVSDVSKRRIKDNCPIWLLMSVIKKTVIGNKFCSRSYIAEWYSWQNIGLQVWAIQLDTQIFTHHVMEKTFVWYTSLEHI